jgi:hypothetical protein
VMQPKQMSKMHNQDPLHGITLKEIVTQLVEEYGWPELSSRILMTDKIRGLTQWFNGYPCIYRSHALRGDAGASIYERIYTH